MSEFRSVSLTVTRTMASELILRPRGSDTTRASRARRFRDKLSANGMVQLNLWVPVGAADDMRILAAIMREHPHLRPGPLRDPVSGKLVTARY
jgi:hypothetical protein